MVSIQNYRHAHLVGIKGVAMAALAQILEDLGLKVTGSDVAEDFVTAGLLKQFPIFTDFSGEHLQSDVDVVIYTGAHQGKNNPEVRAAQSLGIPCYSHAEALGQVMAGKRAISVCGTGGKTTTTAMIAWILECAGLRPSFAIGVGNVPNFNRTGKYVTDSEWFVAEADEYAVDPTSDHRPRFIFQHPEIIVCTNLTYDHPDIYPTFEAMQKTFTDFFQTLPVNGILIDGETAPKIFAPFTLLMPGEHNQRNALYAMLAAKHCGVAEAKARAALEKFIGTMRRFEKKTVLNGMTCYDDYAHTPDEIKATIQALREWEPGKKVILAFQPHTYSRTKALFDGFVESLQLADEVILLPIFASAREAPDQSVSSELLLEKMPPGKCQMLDISQLAGKIKAFANPDTVFITLGAGDIYKVYDKLGITNS